MADGTVVDNRWIVPHSPLILYMMESHANLECYISIKAFKHIHKQIYQGHDRTTMACGEDQNEVQKYLDAIYVSASEASWRLFKYKTHQEYPNVVQLAIHMPNEQSIVYNEAENAQDVINRAGTKDTTLTAYFKAGVADDDDPEIPPHKQA